MALVAYDNSDSSELEDEDEDQSAADVVPKKVDESVTGPSITKTLPIELKETEIQQLHINSTEPSSSHNLFNLLPQPSMKKPAVIEEDDEFLHKKEKSIVKPKAKITVPSLSDFKDVEDRPNAKPKIIANGKKSGLLSILPQPKNAITISTKSSNSLIPYVLTKKPNATAKKKEPLPSPLKKAKAEAKGLITSYSDESDNEDVQNDFFSINKPVDIPIDLDKTSTTVQTNITNDKKPVNIQSYFKQDEIEDHMEADPDADPDNIAVDYYNASLNTNYTEDASSSYSDTQPGSESTNGDAVLDEEAILKLCGTRGKRKREEIQIVDVNQQEVLADAREWLLKGLMDDTTKRVSSSKKKGNEPTTQQRRKHQITYLAHQAKANEAELQNQWANNRMSKRQTQSKYGF